VLIWRDEEPMVIAATVQEVPTAPPRPGAHSAPAASPADPGWQLAAIDEVTRQAFGLDGNSGGVVVTQIAADGAAAEAGLHAGDVIVQIQQEKVAAAEDVRHLLDRARQQQRRYVVVLVRNADGLRWHALSLE
jgi:serine protease Do